MKYVTTSASALLVKSKCMCVCTIERCQSLEIRSICTAANRIVPWNALYWSTVNIRVYAEIKFHYSISSFGFNVNGSKERNGDKHSQIRWMQMCPAQAQPSLPSLLSKHIQLLQFYTESCWVDIWCFSLRTKNGQTKMQKSDHGDSLFSFFNFLSLLWGGMWKQRAVICSTLVYFKFLSLNLIW